MLLIASPAYLVYNPWVVHFAIIFICASTWLLNYHSKRLLGIYCIAIGVLCGVVIIYRIDEILLQMEHIRRCFAGQALKPQDVTTTIMLLMSAVSLMIFLWEFVIKSHMLLNLMATVLVMLGPVVGIPTGKGTVILLTIFQVSFWIIHSTGRGRGRLSIDTPQKSRTSGKSAAVAIAAMAFAFAVANAFATSNAEWLYEAVYDLEGWITRTSNNLRGTSSRPIANGDISRGNNHRTGAKHLELSTYVKPTEPLYLKGFVGGYYNGGHWGAANDDALLHNALAGAQDEYLEIYERIQNGYSEYNASQLDGGSAVLSSGKPDGFPVFSDKRYWIYTLSEYYFSVNRFAAPTDLDAQARYVTVKYESAVDDLYFQPYYNSRDSSAYEDNKPIFINNIYDYAQHYHYYEQKDMKISESTLDAIINGDTSIINSEAYFYYNNFANINDVAIFSPLQKEYMEEAAEHYTDVPMDLVPRLARLCRENPQQSLEDITAFILYTLHSNASYTLTPGLTPPNREIAEYFLFDNGRGYCVHFATAATLLYRLYGIPARYVSGYMVPPSDFKGHDEDEFGNREYTATVTDERAHAWVEIFLEDYGWTPVEVTPSNDGITASYPGLSSQDLESIFSKKGWNLNAPSLANRLNPDGGIEMIYGDGGDGPLVQVPDSVKLALIITGIYTLCILPLLVDYRRLRKLRKMQAMGSRRVFSRLLDMLHYAGYLPGMNGTEPQFAEQLSAALPDITLGEASKMVAIVSEAAYGQDAPRSEDDEFVRSIYYKAASCCHSRLKGIKKLAFRYIKAFC